jgi:hypothetical protein
MPFSTTMVPLNLLEAFFDDDTPLKVSRLGAQFRWETYTAQLTTAWVNLLDLAGPGEIQFLAAWQVGGLTPDADLRLVLDGRILFTRSPAWEGSSTYDGDGYIIVGSCIWDEVASDPEYGGIQLENIPYRSSLKLQIRATSGTNDNDFKAVYRNRTTT